MTQAPDAILARLRLSSPAPLAVTALAQLWHVQCADGSAAVLKCYRRPDRGNEAGGAQLMRAWDGKGAAKILQEDGAAVLMEFLEGPGLGEIARGGAPGRADALLAETAQRLHRAAPAAPAGLMPLDGVFAALFQAEFAADACSGLRQDILRGAALARGLLDSQPAPCPLHGDLHHDNVILTAEGPKAFDAKGYLGDPAFELANALRHPSGMPAHTGDPARIAGRLDRFAQALDVNRQRLARWAAAKCALSIAWRAKGGISADPEAGLLSLLLAQADQ